MDVYQDGGDDLLCTAGGNQFMVTFLTEHGDLPMLQFATENVDSFSVTQYLAGSKEVLECAGRGLCNHSTGECLCFPGYGSSDGKGGRGTYRDCGFLEPILKPELEEEAEE